MKRELKTLIHISECCPGHDKYPCETYRNNRSKKARARDIKKEHKLVRTLVKRNLKKEQRDYSVVADSEARP